MTQTFEEPRGSIVTQLPLPDTLMDLWRLVDGCGSDTIVSIGEVDGGKVRKYFCMSLQCQFCST